MVKNLLASAGQVGDVGCITGLGRSPGAGHGNPLQYSCLDTRIRYNLATKLQPVTTEGVDSLDLTDVSHWLRSVPITWQRGTWEKMVHTVYDETVLIWPRKF